jgi:hypothetical protein
MLKRVSTMMSYIERPSAGPAKSEMDQ